jgi:hypothetical protein
MCPELDTFVARFDGKKKAVSRFSSAHSQKEWCAGYYVFLLVFVPRIFLYEAGAMPSNP